MTTLPIDRLLAPEARVLLLLLDTGVGADAHLRELLRAPRFDWNLLIELAELERSTPLLRRRLATFDAGVPDARRAQLDGLARISSFRMSHLQERLVESLELFARADVPVVLLKGAALAATVYDGITDRPMLDADVLVPASDAQRAWDLLRRAGWNATSPAHDVAYASHHHLPPLEDPAGTGLAIEIHTALTHGVARAGISAQNVRAAARSARLGDRAVLVPAPHHCVLHLAVHFAWSHTLAWGGWRAFRDLRAIANSLDVDWDGLVVEARAGGSATAVYWTLRLAHSLTGFEPPAGVLERLRPPRPEPVLRLVERHFCADLFAIDTVPPPATLSRALWSTGMAPRWCGHGGARPWDRDDAWTDDALQADAAAGQALLTQAWLAARYLMGLVRGRPLRSPPPGAGRVGRTKPSPSAASPATT